MLRWVALREVEDVAELVRDRVREHDVSLLRADPDGDGLGVAVGQAEVAGAAGKELDLVAEAPPVVVQ
jgi:hypothetical protein